MNCGGQFVALGGVSRVDIYGHVNAELLAFNTFVVEHSMMAVAGYSGDRYGVVLLHFTHLPLFVRLAGPLPLAPRLMILALRVRERTKLPQLPSGRLPRGLRHPFPPEERFHCHLGPKDGQGSVCATPQSVLANRVLVVH